MGYMRMYRNVWGDVKDEERSFASVQRYKECRNEACKRFCNLGKKSHR